LGQPVAGLQHRLDEIGLAAATGVLPVESRGRRAADRLAHRSSGTVEEAG
jgi:hypothetical protein